MVSAPFTCKDGREVIIDIDELDYTARVKTIDGAAIGRIEFNLQEWDHGENLLFAWAHFEEQGGKYKRAGIGRECLKRVKALSGLEIVARDHDGQKLDDGSHLTGDAPAFVSAMRQEGLIAPSGESINNDEDF